MVDITPPLGIEIRGYFEERIARDVHDSLFAKSLVLDDGETKLAIVVCDLLGAGRTYLDKAKELIRERCGIPHSNVLISCTHTHTGPSIEDMGYGDILVRKISDSVQLADSRLTEAEIGYGREREEKTVGNRRFLMKDGTVRTHPRLKDPGIIAPEGPVDPEIGVFVVREVEGKTLCVLGNYAAHYAGLSPTEKREDMYTISADYCGAFSEMIQRLRGERFVAILANGACADVMTFDPRNPHGKATAFFGHAWRVGGLLAAKAFWAWNEMEFCDSAKLSAAIDDLAIPRRMPTDTEIELARKYVSGKAAPANMRHHAWKNFFGPRIEEYAEAPREVKTWVQVLAIGDLAIVGLPGEIFVEHGLRIKRESPFKYTFIFELANDSVGYVPTLKAFEEDTRLPLEASGSYETTIGPNQLVPEAGNIIVESALKMLDRVHDST